MKYMAPTIACAIALMVGSLSISTAAAPAANKSAAEHPFNNIRHANLLHPKAIKRGMINRFVFTNWAGKDLPVWLYVPDKIDVTKAPVVFMLHGANREPHKYLREWVDPANEHGLIVIAPEFSEKDYPGSAGYNLGNVSEKEGKAKREEAVWSFSSIEPLFDVVRKAISSKRQRYTIYGHSAGAQFVHRYLYFKPDARVDRYIAANAGWYTLPDMMEKYPYGLKDSGISEKVAKEALSKNVLILLGDKDNDPNHESLSRSKAAMRQGPHRFARGLNFHEVGKAQANAYGVRYSWTMEVVPDAAHSNGLIAKAAAPHIR